MHSGPDDSTTRALPPSSAPLTPLRSTEPRSRRFRRLRRWYRRTPTGQLVTTIVVAVVALLLVAGGVVLLLLR